MRSTQIFIGTVLWGAVACGPKVPTKSANRAEAPAILIEDGNRLFAHQGDKRWLVADVDRKRLVASPDRKRFAYLMRVTPKTSRGSALVGFVAEQHRYRVVVQNIDGTRQAGFSAQGSQRPDGLSWVDNQRIGYLAAADHRGRVFVVHQIESGEISERIPGKRHVWSPKGKRVAYVEGDDKQRVRVGDQRVWPRGVVVPKKRRIVGDLVWSPDGEGLAFIQQSGDNVELVVLLALDDAGGDLNWALPPSNHMDSNRIFWANSRVIVGESALKPRFAAGWTRVK